MRDKIKKAVVEMAYDNGAIRRGRTEDQVLANVMDSLAQNFSTAELDAVEVELAALSDEDFEELIIGEADSIPTTEITEKVLMHAFEAL
jgi:hypothetical protein